MLGAAAASFPLTPRIYTPVMIVGGFIWLLTVSRHLSSLKVAELKWTLIAFFGMYGVQVIGLVYTTEWAEAMKKLETKSSMLILPAFILLSGLTLAGIRVVLWSFTISIFSIVSYLLFFALRRAIEAEHGFTQFFGGYQYQTTYFTAPLEIHPTYLSLFISFTIFFIAETLINASTWRKILSLLAVLFLVTINFVLLSRGALIGFGLAGMIYIIQKFGIAKRHYWMVFGVIGVYLVLITAAYTLIPNIKHRFVDQIQGLEQYWNNYYPDNSTSLHLYSWKCSILLIKERLLLGYGTGDEVERLLDCYRENKMKASVENRYNAHNEFLSTMLRHGIFGLTVLVIFFTYVFRVAIRFRDSLLLAVLVLFVVISLFESTLNVYRGVVFLAMFVPLLIRRCAIRNASVG